jgi:protein-tyrosine phosphatase
MSIEPFKVDELLLEGGGRIGICRLPGRSCDLAGDLAIIRRWQPDIVVSMTGAVEMAQNGAGGLPAALGAAGLDHAIVPIPDFGTPTAQDSGWGALSPQLHALLDRGGSLLLHCLAGRGRSGMVAMRLLTDRGLPPDEALSLIRKARPGAVETDAQALWGAGGGRMANKGPDTEDH